MNEIKDIQLKLNAIEVTTNQAGYSKDEIDTKISESSGGTVDLSNYYNKTEVDTKLA